MTTMYKLNILIIYSLPLASHVGANLAIILSIFLSKLTVSTIFPCAPLHLKKHPLVIKYRWLGNTEVDDL